MILTSEQYHALSSMAKTDRPLVDVSTGVHEDLRARGYIWHTNGRWHVTGKGSAALMRNGYRGLMPGVRVMPRRLDTRKVKGNKCADLGAGE